jgi:hypothetical protein
MSSMACVWRSIAIFKASRLAWFCVLFMIVIAAIQTCGEELPQADPREVPSSGEICGKMRSYESGLYLDEPWQFRKWNPCKRCSTTEWNNGSGTSDCVVDVYNYANEVIGEMQIRLSFREGKVVGFRLLVPRPAVTEGETWGRCRAKRKPCDKGLSCRQGICEPTYWVCNEGACTTLAH